MIVIMTIYKTKECRQAECVSATVSEMLQLVLPYVSVSHSVRM
jgi:hypothetical protein